MTIPDIKIRGIRTPIPSGYVLGRTVAGVGDVHLVPIGQFGGVASASGSASAGGAATAANVTATAANQLAQQAMAIAQVGASAVPEVGGNDWPTVPPPKPAVWGAFTVATLPKALTGNLAYITDGDAGLAWGATALNSGAGATTYLCWFNGTNWTVIGK